MENAVRSKLSQMSNLKKEVLLSAKSEKVEMTLNTESSIAQGLLIQRLTELYEDPIEATVRETTSNALDAVTISHTGERPEVKITSPTTLNPILVIKDNGVGMTYDDLKEIYSKYGASTKINDLEQIGAYGLGAKSPLAYGTEFTVSSVKDNQKTIIIVAREEMTNYIKIVDSVYSEEPSGTTVSIPVNTSDISRFSEHVNKYKQMPVDKDVDMYVNGSIVNETDYTVITDKCLISNGDEKVFGRVWIKGSDVVNLISNMDRDDIKKSLKFLIGGWAYESPTSRNKNRYYNNKTGGIIVELKAGIVGFNSSRDAILENERYNILEDLVIDYIESEQFISDITVSVNDMEIAPFMEVISSLLVDQKQWVSIKEGKIKIDISTNRSYSNRIPRKFEFENFTHNKTGFNLNNVLDNIPEFTKPMVVIRERLNTYYKMSKNAMMKREINEYTMFSDENVTDINIAVNAILTAEEESYSYETLLVNLAALVYKSTKSEAVKLTFVTDIEGDDHINKLKSNRKSIIRLRNEDLQEGSPYNSILVYTKNTKSEIEKMIKDINLDPIDIKVYEIDSLLEELKQKRTKRRVNREKTPDVLSTRLEKFYLSDNDTRYYELDDIDETKNNVIIVSRNSYINSQRLSMIHTWYCNENKVDKKSFELYTSCGVHKASDVNLLLNKGVVLRDPTSDAAGLSKIYEDNVHNNVAQLNAIRNEDVDTKEKAFVRLLSGLYNNSPSDVSQRINSALESNYEIAKIANFSLPSLPKSTIDKLAEFDSSSFIGDVNSYSRWRLEETSIEHLLSIVGKEYFGILHDIMAISSSERIVIDEDGKYKILYRGNSLNIEKSFVKSVYEGSNSSSAFITLGKAQIKAHLEFVASIINGLSVLNI